jgi:glycosyltransferase involved in cell wall biosynthesis
MEHVDVFVAPTGFVEARTLELGISPERVRRIPHGTHLPPAARAVPRRRFGYVGGLAEHKGVHVLIEAFRGLSGSDRSLEVYGHPAVHPEYAARLRELAVGDRRISFRGPFPEGEQSAVMDGLDVVVVPSLWWENSPFTLLEARASGAWVVASDTGGMPELLPAGAGRLVPPGDAQALREALEEAASSQVLPTPVPPRTLAEEAAELDVLYRELCSGRPSASAASGGERG